MPPSLADAIFWVAAVCCAIAQWFILRGALTASPPQTGGGTVPATRRRLEVVWAVVPAIALALVLVATWRAIHPGPRGAVPAPGAQKAPR
jgi:heme/copper-type cytochrome/quinol oxidase subunit 2